MPAISAIAPAKAILFGEHAVVYDYPAIAVPVNGLQCRVSIQALPTAPADKVEINSQALKLDQALDALPETNPLRQAIDLFKSHYKINQLPAMRLNIHSSIPLAGGLGSGAAVSVALLKALSLFLGWQPDLNVVNNLSYEVEKFHHGTPSGVDNTVITYGQPLYFRRSLGMQPLEVGADLAFLLIDSGIRATTAAVVNSVRDHLNASPERYTPILQGIGGLVDDARSALREGMINAVGELMTDNHQLLKRLGVSHQKLDQIVKDCLKTGALGAKLSGAGQGGHVICLVREEQVTDFALLLREAGYASVTPFILNASPGKLIC